MIAATSALSVPGAAASAPSSAMKSQTNMYAGTVLAARTYAAASRSVKWSCVSPASGGPVNV